MPTYAYRCRKCDETFEVVLTMKEYREEKRTCPKCGSDDVEQVLDLFFAKTSRKS